MRIFRVLVASCVVLNAATLFAELDFASLGEPDLIEAGYDASQKHACSGYCSCSKSSYVGGINIYGWLDAGVVANTGRPNSKFNGPYNAVDRANEGMMNQLYIVAEKDLPHCGRGVGFRLDMLYGEDYLLAQSIGIERHPNGAARWNDEYYGLAFPQAYVSVGNQDLNVQVGHFYSVVGYEGVMSPDNFFYTKSYSYQFAGPFTHWGAQANWNPSDALTLTLGLHNGWDAFDRVSDRVGFIGKAKYDFQNTGAWTSFAVTTGDDFNNLSGLAPTSDFTNRTRYSWLVSLPLTCRLEYVFHHWLGMQSQGSPTGGQADWYGVDQYAYYTINDCWKAGLRFEWFRDEDGTRVGLNRPSNANNPPFVGNFYSVSCGLNWTPTSNVMVRPELRADWFDGAANPYNDGNDSAQFLMGVDAILMF
ncbi:MAG: porin [Planctomycetaceae bacterium]|nr:porin [Planctomycetales bacterium]MCB9920804.1 porin [Planctomycetaceae bacterium]